MNLARCLKIWPLLAWPERLNGVRDSNLQSGQISLAGTDSSLKATFGDFDAFSGQNRAQTAINPGLVGLIQDAVYLLHSPPAFGIGLRVGGEQSPPVFSDAGVAQW
ncbi:MAG: hypothetical protein V4477_17355 [Pseudomonadota bacterium]